MTTSIALQRRACGAPHLWPNLHDAEHGRAFQKAVNRPFAGVRGGGSNETLVEVAERSTTRSFQGQVDVQVSDKTRIC